MDVGYILKLAPFIALGILSVIFIFSWVRSVRDQRASEQLPNESGSSGALAPARLAIGFGTNFLDTLGIGSFATTTSAFKLLKMVRDEYH